MERAELGLRARRLATAKRNIVKAPRIRMKPKLPKPPNGSPRLWLCFNLPNHKPACSHRACGERCGHAQACAAAHVAALQPAPPQVCVPLWRTVCARPSLPHRACGRSSTCPTTSLPAVCVARSATQRCTALRGTLRNATRRSPLHDDYTPRRDGAPRGPTVQGSQVSLGFCGPR